MRTPLLTLLFILSGTLFAQEMNINFTPADENYPIDSITAMNIRTGESITFPGDETLVLTSGTGIGSINLNQLGALVYPNPNTGQSTLVVNMPEQQEILISVRNQLGQEICQEKQMVQPGPQAFSISLQTAGNYFISIRHSNGLESLQIISTKSNNQGSRIAFQGPQSQIPNPLSLKSGSNNTLPFILGDIILYNCYSSVHNTIMQDMPRDFQDHSLEINFHPCIDPDGMNYPVVEIGEQIWMAKNLAYLPSVSRPDTGSDTEPYYYVYGYNGTSISEARSTENYETYGVLYNWEASKKSCPVGWHLPSDEEWMVMETFLGMKESDLFGGSMRESGRIGMKLKSVNGWNDNGNGINCEGFCGLPGGWRGTTNPFTELGNWGCWWASSISDISSWAWGRFLSNESEGSLRVTSILQLGYSVRCIKDSQAGNQPPTASFTVSPESGPNTTRFTFDASACSDDNDDPEDLMVRWDFDFDQENGWDTEFSTEKTFTITYPDISLYQHIYKVKLEVKDSEGASNIATKELEVDNTGTMTDPRDGKTYKTIVFGDNTWMAENLAYLPSVFTPIANQDVDYKAYYVNEYMGDNVEEAKETDNYKIYGVLYNYNAAIADCPDGWHLPTDNDWKGLEGKMGMSELELNAGEWRGTTEKIGKNLKSKDLWLENGEGINLIGLDLTPGGLMEQAVYRPPGRTFLTWVDMEGAYNNGARAAMYDQDGFRRASGWVNSIAGAVRCVKDK